MQIAIPTFGTRVSPRFDCARTILLITVDDGTSSQRREVVAADWAPHERINKLVELGVDTVVCGGIDRWSAQSLESANVEIYPYVTGEAEEALQRLLRGELVADMVRGPGRRCGRGGRGRGGGRGGRGLGRRG